MNIETDEVGFYQRLLKNTIIRNALSLYGVQIANYIFPLITVPYLSRVLQPEGWGLVVLTQSFTVWLSLIIEYGFNLSATRELSRNNKDRDHVTYIVNGVMGAKALLVIFTIPLVVLLSFIIPMFKRMPEFLILGWMAAVVQGFSPLWYFQGMERIHLPALLNVLARFISTILIFLFVTKTYDGWKVIALQAGAGFFSSGVAIIWLYREVRFEWPKMFQVFHVLRTGWSMFFFRSAVSLYTAANTFILGFFAPATLIGFYAGAEKISKAVLGLLNPISQAIYPRMNSLVISNNSKADRLGRISFMFMGGLGVALGAAIAFFAPLIIKIILGPGYEPAIPVLRLLALLVPIIALSNVLGIQWMLPHGMDKVFNIIIISAGLINIIFAVLLAPRFGPIGMAGAVVTSETFVTVGMFLYLWTKGLNPLGGRKNES